MKEININIANHTSVDFIEDLIEVISDIFKNRKFKIKVSEKFEKNILNIVIDEFSNQKFQKDFNEFKKLYPSSKIILLNTEFITRRYGFLSFNLFTKSPLEIFSIICSVIYLFYRKQMLIKVVKEIKLQFLLLPILSILELPKLISSNYRNNLLHKVKKGVYNYLRFKGFSSVIKKFDYVFYLHPEQISNKIKGLKLENNFLIFPEININKNKLLNNKKKSKIFLTTTGYKTKYRESILNKLLIDQKFYGYQKYFTVSKNINFQEFSKKNTYFLIHTPQERYWPYCSPMRLFRSINKFQTIPVVLKKLSQHPLEDLCLELKTPDIFDQILEIEKNSIKKVFIKNFNTYNKIAKINNNKIFNYFKTENI